MKQHILVESAHVSTLVEVGIHICVTVPVVSDTLNKFIFRWKFHILVSFIIHLVGMQAQFLDNIQKL